MVPPCVKRFRQRGKPNHHAPMKLAKVVLPRKLKPNERYFAALLRSSARDYVESQSDGAQLWAYICQRVQVSPLYHPIESKYSDEHKHFAVRAALVLEESRHAIADGLAKRWTGTTRKPSRDTMKVRCQSAKTNDDTHHTTLKFQLESEKGRFTKEQLFHLRPGTVVEILPHDGRCLEKVVLGCILASSREEIEREAVFMVMVFQPFQLSDQEIFEVTPVAGLISELRQFEACTNKKSKKVPFLTFLMGHWPKHTRFQYDDEDDDTEGDEVERQDSTEPAKESTSQEDKSYEDPPSKDDYPETRDIIDEIFEGLNCISEDETVAGNRHDNEDNENSNYDDNTYDTDTAMIVPQLNKTQDEVATQFIGSSPGSITLVQGPPGTGKSTLLVAIICQYLTASDPTCLPRLMVSAPTNKAVTVVATRFLKALNGVDKYNVVLIGDVEKLLDKEEPRHKGTDTDNHTPLRSIFVYSWMEHTLKEYQTLRFLTKQQGPDYGQVRCIAQRLHQKILRQLPMSSRGEIASLSRKVVKQSRQNTGKAARGDAVSRDVTDIEELIGKLQMLPNDDVCRELLNSANVIFCTLASAGAAVFKWTPKIDDLIVDEAAAATEPLLYIPFHLRPRRLLVVGDPQQLPATVMSKRAVALGYDKSLHERLMHDCQCSYTMLDVQYRMKPEISSFPSSKFYQGKIMNGDNVQCPKYSNPKLDLLSAKPYSFMQVDGKEEQAICGSYRNLEEAHRVVDLIYSLSTASSTDDKSWHDVDRVRIITFYRAQVILLQQLLNRRGLPHVLVATVDSSQGCEADLVIVSFVRSNSGGQGRPSARFTAGFLTDDRRVNVALTRAKFQLICVGNVQAMNTMMPTSTLFGLASNAGERKCIVVADKGGVNSVTHERKRQRNSIKQSTSKRRQATGLRSRCIL